MHTEAVAMSLDGAREGHIDLEVGVGELRLSRSTRPGFLLEGTVELPDDVALEQRLATRDGIAHCDLSARVEKRALLGMRKGPRWDLHVGADVPVRLDVKAGAGECTLDLSDLQLNDLDIEAGVGETRVTFPSAGRPRARIKSGVGETVATIPAGMAARVRVSSGIGSVKVDNRFPRQGNAYVSAGYEEAADRVDLRIEAGVGSIVVRSR
jgi:hypothetical protein